MILVLTFVRLTVWHFHHRFFVFVCCVSVPELFHSLLIQDLKHLSMSAKFHLDVNQSRKTNHRQKYRWKGHCARDWVSLCFLHNTVLRSFQNYPVDAGIWYTESETCAFKIKGRQKHDACDDTGANPCLTVSSGFSLRHWISFNFNFYANVWFLYFGWRVGWARKRYYDIWNRSGFCCENTM